MKKFAVLKTRPFVGKSLSVEVLKVFEERKSATVYKNENVKQNPSQYSHNWQVAILDDEKNTVFVDKYWARCKDCEKIVCNQYDNPYQFDFA